MDDLIETKEGFSGNLGISLNGQSGNKDEQEYSIDSVLRYSENSNIFVLLGDYNYSKTNDIRDEDELFLHARWVNLNFFKPSLDSEVFTQYQYDDFADLSNRTLIGANIRWRQDLLFEADKSQFILGAGAFLEREESEQTNLSETLVRANLYARYLHQEDGEYPFSFFFSAYVQPAVEDVSDLRSLVVTGIEFPIRPSLSIGFDIEVKHNSTPFSDVEKTDIDYGVTLKYSF
uniref:DUF481 domain-containing protein n=1 Tax=Ningiella ruwaisensis TaxID=2364274 RepID=UPI001444A36B|nr:DUF481 domain-containing protein [Ningiella ruwaisensis]